MWKTISFRLTLWYLALFTASSLSLFGLAHFLLSSSLRRVDHQEIITELYDYAATFDGEGAPTLMEELEEDRAEEKTFLLRLADSQNNTVFFSIPGQWSETFDPTQLENKIIPGDRQWIHLKTSDGNLFEISSLRLSEDLIMQVGKSAQKRDEILGQFTNIFAAITLPIVLTGLAGGLFLSRRALQPVRNLISVLNSIIRTGETRARAPVRRTGDELDELSALFNAMLKRIESLILGMRDALDNVAHDLRSPMTRLRVVAESALGSDQNEEARREALADCLEESDHVLTLLDNLMEISEAESGVMKLELEPLNIQPLIEDVTELYRYVAEEKDIAIEASAAEDLLVVADRNRLRQALANLVDNAVKYTPDGGKINIEASEQQQQIRIVVSDTGVGIPQEELSKIWDRLYRGDKSRSQRGLGLGLSLVRAIIRAHRGNVQVISAPDNGSQFILTLPAGRADNPPAAA
jgi:signal transduction histidine kinase